MKFLFNFIIILLITGVFSCGSLPKIIPVNDSDTHLNTGAFLTKKTSLSHSIKAELPGNNNMLAIGVTVADPENKSINAVLMSIEGLVLFDVSYNRDSFVINRSVPPFDSNDFARGLIDDIMLFYFKPDCEVMETGKFNGNYITRYNCGNPEILDVTAVKDGKCRINKYDKDNGLVRTVNILSINEEGIPEKIELIAHGFLGYTIYLDLIGYE